jgi:hypothetical protein
MFTIQFPDTYIQVTNPIRKRWSVGQNRMYDNIYTRYMLSKSNMSESFQEYYSKRESMDALRKLVRVVCDIEPENSINL